MFFLLVQTDDKGNWEVIGKAHESERQALKSFSQHAGSRGYSNLSIVERLHVSVNSEYILGNPLRDDTEYTIEKHDQIIFKGSPKLKGE